MKVLLATDHSKHSKEGAWLLSRLPFKSPPEITLLNVVSVPSMPGAAGMHPAWPRIVESMQQEAHEEVEKAAEEFRGTLSELHPMVRRGQPAREIVAEADHHNYDLIVIGAMGHGAFDRRVLGSVSDSVAIHAHCSTLVVRVKFSGFN